MLAAAFVLVASGFELSPHGAPFPPLLMWVLPVGSAVSLLLGFRAGNLAFAGCLALVVGYAVTHPGADVRTRTARFALLLSLITRQIFVWGFQSTFGRAKRLLDEQQRVIGLRIDEHARLVRTLVDDVQSCLASMTQHFRRRRADGAY